MVDSSYSLRRVDAHTLKFVIGGNITAKIVLRPPLEAALRGVTVDGRTDATFDANSVTVLRTPAEVICTTF